jgi:hypothetical protein
MRLAALLCKCSAAIHFWKMLNMKDLAGELMTPSFAHVP